VRLVADEERLLSARGDVHRLGRLRALLSGGRAQIDAAGYERLGERALREGRPELALEHLRAARILREGAMESPPRKGEGVNEGEGVKESEGGMG
jgi:hypothetical protein